MKRSKPDTRMCVEGLTPGLFFHISSGFEPAAEIEISKKLVEYGAKHVKTQRGKLHFSLAVNHTVTPHVLQSVLGCEGAFVAVANVAGVSADEKCLEDFEKLPLVIGKEQWQAALKLWRFLHSQDEKDPKKLFPSTFRVTVKRGGKHNWKSIDAAGIVGSGMLSDDFKKMTGLDLTVNLKNFDLEVYVHVQHDAATVQLGINTMKNSNDRVSVVDMSLRGATDEGGKVIRLRSSVAANMLTLAEVKPGDILLDPFGGTGSIPFLASDRLQPGLALSSDLFPHPIKVARSAKRAAGAHLHHTEKSSASYELMQADAGALPVRTGSVDVIVSDIPFGKRSQDGATIKALLPKFVAEAERVLRPGAGRMVILCSARSPFQKLLFQSSNLHMEKAVTVSMGGIDDVRLFLVKRKKEATK